MSNKFINLSFMKTFSYNLIYDSIFYGAETWTLWKTDKKYQESFEMWRWRRMEKISWTDRMRNEEVLQRDKETNILHTINTFTAIVDLSRFNNSCLKSPAGQPTLPLSIRINTGSLYRNVSILNYKRDKDNVR